MKAISQRTSREELAAAIVQAFTHEGMSAVLVGGAVVSIYTENRYESDDLDFVSPDEPQKIFAIMKALGFKRKGKDFSHPKTKLFVEFPAREISIGEAKNIVAEGSIKVGKVTVRLLSPTQCVMDRLAAYFHWNDTESLEQAVMVTQAQEINFTEVKAWAKREGEVEKYERYLTRVKL